MELPEHVSIKSSRSYRPLPAVLRAEGEWEGGAILCEFASPMGVVLFSSLRDVMRWLLEVPTRRSQVFEAGAGDRRQAAIAQVQGLADLNDSLAVLIRICDEEVEQSEVGAACAAIATWAGSRGALHAQVAYLQAAALAEPEVTAYALSTAKQARDLSQHRRAETWFRRTIKIARLAKDWSTYIRAYLGLGTMYTRLGNGPAAKAVFERALRSAQRWRLRELAGCAHHDLFHVAADSGDLRRAYEHARSAQANYGDAQDLLTRLAGDIATLWLRVGAGQRASPVFEAIIPLTPDLGLRAVWSAQLVRCAAASGQGHAYEHARAEALTAISAVPDLWRRAEAEAILSLADLAMGQWVRAASVAESALALATRVGAAEVQSYAETALADAKAHRREGGIADALETPGLSRIGDSLAGSLRAGLGQRNASASAFGAASAEAKGD
jgi:tetratricopeptide (TPR) repeat protein